MTAPRRVSILPHPVDRPASFPPMGTVAPASLPVIGAAATPPSSATDYRPHVDPHIPPPLRSEGGLISLVLVPVGVLACSVFTYFFPKIGLALFGVFFAACGMARLFFYRRNNCSHPQMLIVRRPALDIAILFSLAVSLIIVPFTMSGW